MCNVYQLWLATYDPELHERAEIAKENAEKRVKTMEEMRINAVCKDPRFDHSNCE